MRSGRLTDVAAHRVAELLGRFQVPISGVVLVGARGRRADGYGYGYGYGDTKKRKRSAGTEADRSPRADRADASTQFAGPEDGGWPFAPQVDGAPGDAARSRRSRRTSSSA